MYFITKRFASFTGLFFLLIISEISIGKSGYDASHRAIHTIVPNRRIDAVYTILDDIATSLDKIYYWYDNSTIHLTQGNFSGHLLDGQYAEYYYPANNLFTKGSYYMGLKNDEWQEWYENGNLKETLEWDHGLIVGERCFFNQAGKIIKTEHYKKGLLNGRVLEYAGDTISKVIYYKNGILQPLPNKTFDKVSEKNKGEEDSKVKVAHYKVFVHRAWAKIKKFFSFI